MALEIIVFRAKLFEVCRIDRCGLATRVTQQLLGVAGGALEIVANIMEAPNLIACLAVAISALLG